MTLHLLKTRSIRTLILLGACTLLQINTAYSQGSDVQEAVRACQQIEELSFRLACYDRAFPPMAPMSPMAPSNANADTAGTPTATTSGTAGTGNARVTTPANTGQVSTPPAPAPRADNTTQDSIFSRMSRPDVIVQIVEVERIDLRNSRLVTEDGQIFLESNSTTVTRWPDTPFDVEVQRSITGTLYLVIPGGNGRRIRVALAN